MVTTLILTRHCQAAGNLDRTFQGSTDSEITSLGEKQLVALSEEMKNHNLDVIYTSPLKRARLTAEAMNEYHNVDVVVEDRIQEINVGDWELRKWEDIEKEYPEEYELWENSPEHFVSPNGESMQQVYDRAVAATLDMVEQNRGKTIGVASHGCTIRNIACWASGKGLAKMPETYFCGNVAYSILEIDEDNNPKLVSYNNNSHLSEDLQ